MAAGALFKPVFKDFLLKRPIVRREQLFFR